MMHYSLDDRVMRPSGCCNDSSMPSCQSDFVADECVSFLQSFDLRSRGVNLCTSERNDNIRDASDPNTLLVGGEGDVLYSLFHKGGMTSIELNIALDAEGEDHSAVISTSDVSMTITQQREDYVCLTTTSSSCISTSTVCVYKSMGHFDGFMSTPFMSNHVMKFLANDVCSINDGSWNQIKNRNRKVCGCAANGFNGVFCLDMDDDSIGKITIGIPEQSDTESLTDSRPVPLASDAVAPVRLPAWSIILVATLLMVAAAITMTMSRRRYRKESYENAVDFNSNQAANILRGFNPYRDQFNVKTKNSDRNRRPNRRLDIHQPLGQSNRSLEPVDIVRILSTTIRW
jgi:hypothetical protein